jgi:membrane-bound lytic murein transglycosylase D
LKESILQKLILTVFTAAIFIGCSEKPVSQNVRYPAENYYGNTTLDQPAILLASNDLRGDLYSFAPDTVIPAVERVERIAEPDTTLAAVDTVLTEDEKNITDLLEIARGHYLAAMQAQAEGDSSTSSLEFEEAIKHLNEASYYPDIESNSDFNDLTRSVIEDYEKYIATVDSLGVQSSIFALREKLSLEIEKIDITDIQIPASLIPRTDVPLHINEYTKRTIAFFMGKGRVHIENWIYRSGKYFPMMTRIFAEEGLPQELVYLAMTESGLNPTARSWAKAVGLWQFMKSTGSLYGLRSNYWYDERRDFEKSTRAAARHMKDLYASLNDWHLVFAAYNAGPGWVRKASRRAGSNDFWELRHRLPRETRNYVPQYIAVTLILTRPESFGFENIAKADSLAYEYVTVDDCVSLELLAECASTDLTTIQDLNPELIQWCTPPNYKGYQLRVPYGSAAVFAEKYAQIPDDKKFDFATHTVRRGESVGTIAKKYGINTSAVFEVNKISRKTLLRVGSTLVIPIQSRSVAAVVDAQRKKELEDRKRAAAIREQQRSIASRSSVPAQRNRTSEYVPTGRAKIVYTVKKGETIGHIAEWFRVRASNIRNWNNIPYGRYIYPGQKLKVWVPEERYEQYKKIASLPFTEKQKTISSKSSSQRSAEPRKNMDMWTQHKVKRGESLEKIAAAYDVAIADIKSWNKLRTSRIYAGQVLEIFSAEGAAINGENGNGNSRPVKSNGSVATKPDRTVSTHLVQRGESLEMISKMYDVSIADLQRWNNLSGSRITAGQRLTVHSNGSGQGKSSTTEQSPRSAASSHPSRTGGKDVTHVVKRGETLEKIAEKYSVTISNLKKWNHLSGSMIKIGQKLIVRTGDGEV